MAIITIIGAGAMGSALTVPLAANGHEVRLWGTELDCNIIEQVRRGKPHPAHKHVLPAQILTFQAQQLAQAVKGADLIIMAITSTALAQVFQRVLACLDKGMVIGSVSKGFAEDNGRVVLLPAMLQRHIPAEWQDDTKLVVVGGPCKATELLWRAPTAVVYASYDRAAAHDMARLLTTDHYRVEVSDDVVGVEVCAALKNAYAVALGMAEGFGERQGRLYNNTKSALFNYALHEMAAVARAMDGSPATAYHLAGAGDLEVTGEAGRNRIFGRVIGSGLTVQQAVAEMREQQITVEGYTAVALGYRLTMQLADDGLLERPAVRLLTALYQILYRQAPPFETIHICLKDYTRQ